MATLSSRFLSVCFVLSVLLTPLRAQVALPFDLAVEQDGSFTPVAITTTLTLQAPGVNQEASLRLRIRNIRSSAIMLTAVNVVGSRFTVDAGSFPALLQPGGSITATVRYSAGSSVRAVGELLISHFVTSPAEAQTARLAIAGVAPEFRVSYTIGSSGDAAVVTPGGQIAFPQAPVNSTTVANMTVLNAGSGPGAIQGVQVTGSSFRTQGLPVFPLVLPASSELRFVVQFTPAAPGPAAEGGFTLQLEGATLQAVITGTGAASMFTYELILPRSVAPMTPGQRVPLPATRVGDTLPLSVRVTNGGNTDGTVAAISVLGPAFSISQAPILPVAIPQQGSIVFSLDVTPREPGPAIGLLRVGNDSFDLEIVGEGARTRYSYRLSGVPISVLPLESVRFPTARLGETSEVLFEIRNDGNQEAVIPNLAITPASGAYSIADATGLPIRLQPGESSAVALLYSPTTLDDETATLTVGSDSFALAGTSSPPPPLPPFTISGVSDPVQQMDQPLVGLSIEEPYPVLLRGELILSFESAVFAGDPSIQFATGGRVAGFTIPAGERDAVFSNGSNRVRFQTGTVAGNIVLTPRFTVGTFVLGSEERLRVTLPPSAPRLLSMQLLALTASSMTLELTASTPTRSLEALEFVFTSAPGSSRPLSESTIQVSVSTLADNFFRSTASETAGGVFFATVPFALSVGGGNLPNLASIVSQVTATVVNSQGRSNAISVPIR